MKFLIRLWLIDIQRHWVEIENNTNIISENVDSLHELLDTFSENLAALKILEFPTG